MIAPSDVLFRAGGRTLARQGVPVRRLFLPARGGEQMAEVFARADATTCATFLDRAGTARLASAGRLRCHWADVNADGIYETPALLSEGPRTNLIENGNSEADIVGWNGAAGTETLTRDNAQALCGGWACKVVTVNAVASGCWWNPRAGGRIAAAAATTYTLSVWIYGTGTAVGKTMLLAINWWNAVPAVISTSVTGAIAIAAGWNRYTFTATSPAGTISCQPLFYTSAAQGVFTFWADLATFTAAAFADQSPGIATGAGQATRASEDLTAPVNFGPMDLSVYAEILRPPQFDAVGAIADASGIFDLGDAADNHLWFYGDSGSRSLFAAVIAQGQTSLPAQPAPPAGALVEFVVQLKGCATGPQVALDTGAGLGAFSAPAAKPLLAWANQRIRIGGITNGAHRLWGGMIDLIVARGLHAMPEFRLVP